jgi:ADP-ribosylglycohydrolase
VNVPEMHVRRAPGITCLKALQSNRCGTPQEPINNSKGCGCVMRMAPAGLYFDPDAAFEKGVEFAAITHGHPVGYLSAGAFSYLISNIMDDFSLQKAVENTLQKLAQYREARACFEKVEQAYRYAKTEMDHREVISSLGLGWVCEEALSIGIYCALHFQNNIQTALISAVNHDGDSDSTGSITGNILGAYLGVNELPQTWVDRLELKEVIIQVADELWMKYQEALEDTTDFFHSADIT